MCMNIPVRHPRHLDVPAHRVLNAACPQGKVGTSSRCRPSMTAMGHRYQAGPVTRERERGTKSARTGPVRAGECDGPSWQYTEFIQRAMQFGRVAIDTKGTRPAQFIFAIPARQ
jgi:hypothetical protein